jgi:hypothetical protein
VPDHADQTTAARWRLVLGRFAERRLGGAGADRYARMDRALDYLYGREYAGRGVRGDRHGGSQASVLAVPDWLQDVRELFPRETVEIIERHALERYGMTELVTDEETLRKMEPSYELLKAVLSFRHLMAPKVLEVARQLVKQPQTQPAQGRAQPRLAPNHPGQPQALRSRAQADNRPVAALLVAGRASHPLAHHHGRRLQRIDDGLGHPQRGDGGDLPGPAGRTGEPGRV